MKKNLGVILMTALLCLGGGIQAFAADKEYEISPYYENINSIVYSITEIDGEIVYAATVNTLSAERITVYLELQRLVGSSWRKLSSSTGNAYDKKVYSYEDSYEYDPSESYRVYYKVTVYYDNGKSESDTKYKYY